VELGVGRGHDQAHPPLAENALHPITAREDVSGLEFVVGGHETEVL
jgi:hypothetical protein